MQFDALPSDVVATIETRDAWRRHLAQEAAGLEFLASDLDRWPPGSTIRVAFLGGGTQLHAQIDDATKQITDACSITFDFGFDATGAGYRRWSESTPHTLRRFE